MYSEHSERNEPSSNPYTDEKPIPYEVWEADMTRLPEFPSADDRQGQIQGQEIQEAASGQVMLSPFPSPVSYPYYAPGAQQPYANDQLRTLGVGSLVAALLLILTGFAWLYMGALNFFSNLLHMRGTGGGPFSEGVVLISFIFFLLCSGGGGIILYHSIRTLLGKRSAIFVIPHSVIWISTFIIILFVGLFLQIMLPFMITPTLTIIWLLLVLFVPMGGIISLCLQHFSLSSYLLTWRRLAISLLGGAAGATTFAYLVLFALTLVTLVITQFFTCITNPSLPICTTVAERSPYVIFFLLAVLVPFVEEIVKPLPVLLLMMRIGSRMEAWLMGVLCGVGFGCVEALLLLAGGSSDWLALALVALTFILLHSFSTALTILGWYHLIHKEERRVRKTITTWLSALVLHIIVNASWAVALLPTPFGPTIRSWHPALGSLTITATEVLFSIEIIGMFLLFLFVAGRLKKQASPEVSTTTAF